MNSPSVKQVISLSPTEKLKLTSTASRWTSEGAVVFSTNRRLSQWIKMNGENHGSMNELLKHTW